MRLVFLKKLTLIGHSIGELSALLIGESFNFRTAIRILEERAKIVKKHCPPDAGFIYHF
jgi:malonyl CoA-acyl carrier protein transacylase